MKRSRFQNKKQYLCYAALITTISSFVPSNAQAVPLDPLGYKAPPPGNNIAINANQSYSYDTNPLKLVNGSKAVSGSLSTASIMLNSDTDTRTAQLNSIISQGLYNDSDFNTTNAHEILTLNKKNQRWNVGLDSRLDYDTTRGTEITSFGIRAPNVRNTKLSATPNVGFRVNPLNTLGLSATWLNSTYDNAAFIDYSVYEIKPSLRHKIDPRNTAVIKVNTQRYETQQGIKTTTDTISPTLGWIWDYSDNLTAHFDVGAQRTTQERANSTRKDSQTTYVYSGNLNYTEESNITDFTLSRAQRPSGNGVSFLLTTIDLKESYIINDRLVLRGGLGYQTASYVANPGINLDTQYSGNTGIAYRIIDDVDITANYDYTHQKLTSSAGTLNAQTVLVGFTYHPSEYAF